MFTRSKASRFTKSQRLLRRADFHRVTQTGRRATSRHFVVLASPVEGNGPRLGIIVSKRVGNAVQRNRVKRRIREWFRQIADSLEPMDLVVIARRGAPELETETVSEELNRALPKAMASARGRR